MNEIGVTMDKDYISYDRHLTLEEIQFAMHHGLFHSTKGDSLHSEGFDGNDYSWGFDILRDFDCHKYETFSRYTHLYLIKTCDWGCHFSIKMRIEFFFRKFYRLIKIFGRKSK